ncbi:hypothetical protein D9613_008194 [Agrocybe pediades]|uniref:Uncharacterized protein n=1 Tax=Agrocybe pediades TaxID=84607 RepID=A0A8H4QLW3_9AGAR|nr:hypothetical protein D9613_008194 [Agrocybe pediades]
MAVIPVRKCRCTYVKFHRQTAPAGPGHNPHPASISSSTTSSVPSASGLIPLPSSSSTRLPPFPQQPEDDFILGPPPSSHHTHHGGHTNGLGGGGLPTMAETLYNSNSFAFPPLYPTNSTSTSATVPSSTVGVLDTADLGDYSSKYHRAQAQAELFGPGRSGLGTGLTPLYDPRGTSSTSASGTNSGGWLGGWDASTTASTQQQPPQPQQQHSQQPQDQNDPYSRQHHHAASRQDISVGGGQHHHQHGNHFYLPSFRYT